MEEWVFTDGTGGLHRRPMPAHLRRRPAAYQAAVPVFDPYAPGPGPFAGPGGAVAPGQREPWGDAPTPAARSFAYQATGFDDAWGRPPDLFALAWNPIRRLYEPVRNFGRDVGQRASQEQLYAEYARLAREGVFVQAYQDEAAPGTWRFRWVRVRTPWPSLEQPYQVLGDYGERFLPAAQRAIEAAHQRQFEAEAARQAERMEIREREEERAAARNLPLDRVLMLGPAHAKRAPAKPGAPSDYAWIAQRALPKGCPYPYPYMPVPQKDYATGAWLSPDYTPSIPLPPPFDLVPWRCGVPAAPQSDRGKGGPFPEGPPVEPTPLPGPKGPPPGVPVPQVREPVTTESALEPLDVVTRFEYDGGERRTSVTRGSAPMASARGKVAAALLDAAAAAGEDSDGEPPPGDPDAGGPEGNADAIEPGQGDAPGPEPDPLTYDPETESAIASDPGVRRAEDRLDRADAKVAKIEAALRDATGSRRASLEKDLAKAKAEYRRTEVAYVSARDAAAERFNKKRMAENERERRKLEYKKSTTWGSERRAELDEAIAAVLTDLDWAQYNLARLSAKRLGGTEHEVGTAFLSESWIPADRSVDAVPRVRKALDQLRALEAEALELMAKLRGLPDGSWAARQAGARLDRVNDAVRKAQETLKGARQSAAAQVGRERRARTAARVDALRQQRNRLRARLSTTWGEERRAHLAAELRAIDRELAALGALVSRAPVPGAKPGPKFQGPVAKGAPQPAPDAGEPEGGPPAAAPGAEPAGPPPDSPAAPTPPGMDALSDLSIEGLRRLEDWLRAFGAEGPPADLVDRVKSSLQARLKDLQKYRPSSPNDALRHHEIVVETSDLLRLLDPSLGGTRLKAPIRGLPRTEPPVPMSPPTAPSAGRWPAWEGGLREDPCPELRGVISELRDALHDALEQAEDAAAGLDAMAAGAQDLERKLRGRAAQAQEIRHRLWDNLGRHGPPPSTQPGVYPIESAARDFRGRWLKQLADRIHSVLEELAGLEEDLDFPGGLAPEDCAALEALLEGMERHVQALDQASELMGTYAALEASAQAALGVFGPVGQFSGEGLSWFEDLDARAEQLIPHIQMLLSEAHLAGRARGSAEAGVIAHGAADAEDRAWVVLRTIEAQHEAVNRRLALIFSVGIMVLEGAAAMVGGGKVPRGFQGFSAPRVRRFFGRLFSRPPSVRPPGGGKWKFRPGSGGSAGQWVEVRGHGRWTPATRDQILGRAHSRVAQHRAGQARRSPPAGGGRGRKRSPPLRRGWRHGDRIPDRDAGIDLLEGQGLDRQKAKDWWDSGTGTRTVEDLTPGKRYIRYAPERGDAGRGSFLTDRSYGSAAEAKRALDLPKPPRYEQVVEIVDVGGPVQGIRSGVANGARDATQVALPRRDVYRIIEERPIR